MDRRFLIYISFLSILSAFSMGKSHTRPGVAAADRLAARTCEADVILWKTVEARYDDMIACKGGDKLLELDSFCKGLSVKFRQTDHPLLSKAELLKVVEWKFGKGKPRWALLGHLNSNGDDAVKKASSDAFEKSCLGNISGAIKSLCELKGVGPATASAILSIHREDLFAFMDDEVIECLYDGKRGYTLKIYLDVNSQCAKLANILGSKEWSPRRVGRALWAAARVCAEGGEDLTLEDCRASSSKAKTRKNAPPTTIKRSSKRLKSK